jgi:23S rRNA pseudouridine2605 synthase
MSNLRKALTEAGVASRRKAEALIFEGRVRVNGEVVTTPQLEIDPTAKITVNHEPLKGPEKKVCYIFHKPVGYLCSHKRRGKTERLVYDFFGQSDKRLFTIGRLDKDTSGLLLITNDGELSHEISHPSKEISKEYIAKSSAFITPHHLNLIAQGCEVEGVFVKPQSVQKIRNGTVKIVVLEGRNREVRSLMENAGLNVTELKRTRIGNLMLGNLPEGSFLPLTDRKRSAIFG